MRYQSLTRDRYHTCVNAWCNMLKQYLKRLYRSNWNIIDIKCCVPLKRFSKKRNVKAISRWYCNIKKWFQVDAERSFRRSEIASRTLRHTRETIDRCVARLWMKD